MHTYHRWFVPLLLIALASPAAADRLVTTRGETLETEGSWTVQGRLVVFTTPGGELVSIRLSEIDLEASRKATEEAARPPQPTPEPPPREAKSAVFVLTDRDVRKSSAPLGSDLTRELADEFGDLGPAYEEALRIAAAAGERFPEPTSDLTTPEGLREAASYFTGLAGELRRESRAASGDVRAILEAGASSLEMTAQLARSSPELLIKATQELEDTEPE